MTWHQWHHSALPSTTMKRCSARALAKVSRLSAAQASGGRGAPSVTVMREGAVAFRLARVPQPLAVRATTANTAGTHVRWVIVANIEHRYARDTPSDAKKAPPVDHGDFSVRRAKLDGAPHSVRVAPHLKRDRTGEGHADVLGEPVVHSSQGVGPLPETGNRSDRAERSALECTHVDEARHALGEGKDAEAVAELRTRPRCRHPCGAVVEHRTEPCSDEALWAGAVVEHEDFVGEVLDEKVGIAVEGDLGGCA